MISLLKTFMFMQIWEVNKKKSIFLKNNGFEIFQRLK